MQALPPHSQEPEPHSPGALTTVGALGWGMKSEKQLCATFPSPSCPYWVWDLVS